jgi:hypothetical protein
MENVFVVQLLSGIFLFNSKINGIRYFSECWEKRPLIFHIFLFLKNVTENCLSAHHSKLLKNMGFFNSNKYRSAGNLTATDTAT